MKTIPEDGGRPVAWDPCRPIHLVVNNADAPPGAEQLIREAVESVHSVTGLHFVIEGATTETPMGGRGPVATSRHGDRWSPALLAWTEPAVVHDLQGDVAGFAGPVSAPYLTASQQHWVSGTVNLDGPQFRALLQTLDGWSAARAIIMHEPGHLVGLTHVPVKDQLMYQSNVGQRAFGLSDREGLRQLGLGPCFTS
ncbi:M10 family metallopeptidase domain-containing protein [Terrabacter terrigena]|uniref:Peptidase M10 metallopeptidase domain-containing protein n=1 Tax=Terrabacter terrigena TaxID=574718 RepID=A0ABW3MZY8_9MICO